MPLLKRTSRTASEGDAYRYTKKVLHDLYDDKCINPFIVSDEWDADLGIECARTPETHTAVADENALEYVDRQLDRIVASLDDTHDRLKNIVAGTISARKQKISWERSAFNRIRMEFFHDGISDIYFAPGAMRIACEDLDYPQNADPNKMLRLGAYIQMISMGHRLEYTRKLASVHTGEQLTFKILDEMFGEQLNTNFDELKKRLESIEYGELRYRIIWLRDFSVAHSFARFTRYGDVSITWCHLEHASMFNNYERNCTTRLYLAVLPGFENMTPDDPEFGESMLGIDIGPGGRLVHVNNRWNHARDSIDVRKGDNKYSPEELSVLLGAPYYTLCVPYPDSVYASGFDDSRTVMAEWDRVRANRGTFTDERDGTVYNTIRIGSLEMFCEPLRYGPDPDGIPGKNVGYVTYDNDLTNASVTVKGYGCIGTMYTKDMLESAIPDGWRVPTRTDLASISDWCIGESHSRGAGSMRYHKRALYDSVLRDIVYVDSETVALRCGVALTMQGKVAAVDDMRYNSRNFINTSANETNASETFPAMDWNVLHRNNVSSANQRMIRQLQLTTTCTWYSLDADEAKAHAEAIIGAHADPLDLYCLGEYYDQKVAVLKYCGYACGILTRGPIRYIDKTVACTVYCVRDAR